MAIKVKDTGIIGPLIIGMSIFPIVFFLLASVLDGDYLLGILATFIIYTTGFIILYRAPEAKRTCLCQKILYR